ncbi:MAG: porin [Tidjanibacter sp.]|nr:porin [Tidjanibacter sp.]MBR7102142.1 porin [Tidjanibacter sp.]
MKKGLRLAILVWAVLTAGAVQAQRGATSVTVQTRLSGVVVADDGVANDALSKLGADYLNVAISGEITSGLSVTWRQRFNKPITSEKPLNATDLLYLAYQPSDNWSISVGQHTLAIGGWEYDRAPINVYFASEFWNNIACYQLGINASYTNDKQTDTFVAQLSQSPFDTPTTNLYGAELMWYGSHGIYRSAHSINLYEYRPDKYICYISLGNKLLFRRLTLELDAMCRTAGEGNLLASTSVMGGLSWAATDRLNILLRATYDRNNATTPPFDYTLHPGTELTQVGGGIEYFPLGTSDLRLHAIWSAVSGNNTNPDGVLQGGRSAFRFGATWYLPILSLHHR